VKAYLHFDSSVISEPEYQMFKKSFNSQIQMSEDNIANLRDELSRLDDDKHAKMLIERFMEHENITELNRRIVTGLVKSITVNNNKDIGVCFRYASDYDLPHEESYEVIVTDVLFEKAVV
jgi:hypothetical protein